jgi:pimeloyl-ACP methyl ester carboxylesterase
VGPERERIGDLLLDRLTPSGPARQHRLLLVHGMWGGTWYFENYLRLAAAEGWDAWAVNLRGHGGSRPVPDVGRLSVLDYVADVTECLALLGPAVVVGHSMGGLIAQKVAEGGGVRAAVFLTSAAPRGIVVLRWPVLRRLARYLPAMARGRAFLPTAADAAALLAHRLSPAEQAALHARLVPESGRAALELALGRVAVNAGLVTCPTLVMGAGEDRITPAGVQRRIAARYGAPYLEAAGHAHMLMLEPGWERPFGRLLQWLDRVAGGQREGAAPAPAGREP